MYVFSIYLLYIYITYILCMYILIHTLIHTCTYIHNMHTYVCVQAYMYVCVYLCICVCTYICVYVYSCIYVCIYVCKSVCIHMVACARHAGWIVRLYFSIVITKANSKCLYRAPLLKWTQEIFHIYTLTYSLQRS